MEKAIEKHPVKITMTVLVGLVVSIAYNFFGGGVKWANLINRVERIEQSTIVNAEDIADHRLATNETLVPMQEDMQIIREGLVKKGIIEPKSY